LKDRDLDTVFKQLHNALIVFPAKQAVYGGETVLLPTRTPVATWTATPTPMPTATLDPGGFDMNTARVYTSFDGVLSLSLPRGWQVSQPAGDLAVWEFFLGDSINEQTPSFQIVVGSLDQLGLNEDEIASGTAQGILEAIKKDASEHDPGTY